MKVGDLVKLEEHNEWIGIVTEAWRGSDIGLTMGSVEWNKDMGVGLYFADDLEVINESR